MNSIFLKAPLSLRASATGVLPSQFTGVAYSGGVVVSHGVVIDLASTTVATPMPLLPEHVRSATVGTITSAANNRSQLTVEGRLFSDMVGSTAEQIAQLAQRGAPLQMSVGLYSFSGHTIGLGQQLTVNS